MSRRIRWSLVLRTIAVLYAVIVTSALMVGAIEARSTVSEMEERVDALERDVHNQQDAHQDAVKRIDTTEQATALALTELQDVSKAMGDRNGFTFGTVTNRLGKLEDRVEQIDSRIGAVGRDVSQLYRYVPGFQAQENGGWRY